MLILSLQASKAELEADLVAAYADRKRLARLCDRYRHQLIGAGVAPDDSPIGIPEADDD
jgi:hypothetical protein